MWAQRAGADIGKGVPLTTAPHNRCFAARHLHVMNHRRVFALELNRDFDIRGSLPSAILHHDTANQNHIGDFIRWQRSIYELRDVVTGLPKIERNDGDGDKKDH